MDLVVPYSVTLAAIFTIFTVYMIYRFARSDVQIPVLFTVFCSWSLTFSFVWVLCIDLYMESNQDMRVVWTVVYWTSFGFMWAVLPMQQEFYDAGDFTLLGKIRYSLISNLKFYGLCAALLIAIVILVVATDSVEGTNLPGFMLCLSNIWGLTVAILLLGYGLVELPRNLWQKSFRQLRFRYLCWKTTKVRHTFDDALDDMTNLMELSRRVAEKVANTPADAKEPLDQFGEAMVASFPSEQELNALGARMNVRRRSGLLLHAELVEFPKALMDLDKAPTHDITGDKMALLHYYLRKSVSAARTTKIQYDITLRKTVHLEDELNALDARPSRGCWTRVKWGWRVYYKAVMYRSMAIISGLLSLAVLWSEITIMFPTIQLSPFGAFIESSSNAVATQIWSFIGLGYMALCAFYSAFVLKLGKYYHMHGARATETVSLLLNAAYVQRLIAPLGYNFLTFIRIDGTMFQEIMAQMNVVPFLGSSLNVYLPLLILFFCIATAFNLYSKLLKSLHLTRFSYTIDEESGEDIHDAEIQEGKRLLERYRRTQGSSSSGASFSASGPAGSGGSGGSSGSSGSSGSATGSSSAEPSTNRGRSRPTIQGGKSGGEGGYILLT